jgi:hypothetical protein
MPSSNNGRPKRVRVGIVTEGETEIYCLPCIYPALELITNVTFLKPLRATVDPQSPIPVLAKGLSTAIRLARANKASIVVVLLDREVDPEAPGLRSAKIQAALQKEYGEDIHVVLKDSTFENWLVASPEAFEAQPARYPKGALIRKAATPDKADRVNAISLINRAAATGRRYDKIQDGKRTAKFLQVDAMASHSRSFRRFLAILGDNRFANGSKNPVGA